jgi:hypothetical protein
MRRIVVTHTATYLFDPAAVEKAWQAGLPIPDALLRGDEDTRPDERAITIYEALGDSLLELFHPLHDDDVGYEVEDYDPEA